MNRVFYFHVPKTAGSSLTNLLDKHFNRTIHHIEGRGPFDEDSLSNIDAVSGHLSYSKVASILDLTKWTTIATFREPYSHVISHISWVRKLADEGEEERFRRHPKIFQDLALYMKTLDLSNSADIDRLIKHFLSIDFHYYHNTQTLYMDHHKRLDSAVVNMKNINVLGLTESMDSFYTRLHSLFDWPMNDAAEKIMNKNSNKYGLDITNEKIRKSLYPLIDKDLLLYKEAVKLVNQQEKKGYIDASRNTKSVGQIGYIFENRVIGWGKYLSSDAPANVELYINDQLREVKLAKDFREHVQQAKIHSTGECGFVFDLKKSPLKDGDKVSVKLTDDVMFLKNSNQIFRKKNAG